MTPYQTFLRISFALVALVVSSQSKAAYPTKNEPFIDTPYHAGFYTGLGLGWGRQGLKSEKGLDTSTNNMVFLSPKKVNGFAGRWSLGYNMHTYFALELGVASWQKGTYKESIINGMATQLATGTVTTKTRDVDALLKVMYPLQQNFNLFVKAGGAYVFSNTSVNSTLKSFAPILNGKLSGKENRFYPEGALGMDYRWDHRWSLGLHYHYIFGSNNHPLKGRTSPSLQLLLLNLQYDMASW